MFYHTLLASQFTHPPLTHIVWQFCDSYLGVDDSLLDSLFQGNIVSPILTDINLPWPPDLIVAIIKALFPVG